MSNHRRADRLSPWGVTRALQPLRFALTRAPVQVKTVASEYLGNGLAYFRLSAFAESTPRDLAVAAHTAIEKANGKLRGVVLEEPSVVAINVRCLEDIDIDALPVTHFDGRSR